MSTSLHIAGPGPDTSLHVQDENCYDRDCLNVSNSLFIVDYQNHQVAAIKLLRDPALIQLQTPALGIDQSKRSTSMVDIQSRYFPQPERYRLHVVTKGKGRDRGKRVKKEQVDAE
jgi:hypothetical protein